MRNLAVIFDMDGVLVDSYQAHFRSWQQLSSEQGVEFSEAGFARTFGRTSRDILANHWPKKLSADEVAAADERKEELYRQMIRADFPEMPGARRLIQSLHEAGFHLAVASSGPRANIDVSLEGLGLGPLFEALVSGQDVTHGKPDPAVFLRAGEKLGIAPKRCAVVEDAPAGVEAANRAGMTPIAITGTVDRPRLAGARIIVDRLSQLSPKMIARLIEESV